MKRYLISGALLLIAGQFLTSCHDKMETEYISNPVSAKTEEFDKAFKEAFTSNIDPNQDWGFGLAKKATTRYANTNAADGNSAWALPDDISEAERQKVMAHFANPSNYTASVRPGYINYWVQHVGIGNHSYTTEPDNNNTTATVKANEQMDYLFVYEGDNRVHIERFNASSGSKMFMQSSESKTFGYHNSYASEYVANRFLIQLIDGAYYVGFDYSGTTENKVVKADGIYDDWVIKLVEGGLDTGSSTTDDSEQPGTSENQEDNDNDADPDNTNNPGGQQDLMTETHDAYQTITRTEYFKKRQLLQYGRVFCEDLGANYASNHKDFDYNDVVFDAYLYRDEIWKKTSKIKVYEVRKYEKQVLERPVTDERGEYVYNDKPVLDSDGNQTYDDEGNPVTEPVLQWEDYNALVYKESEVRNEQDGQPVWERVTEASEISGNNLDNEGRGRRYYADILLMACGATKPIKVGGSDAPEVHSAFGGYSVDCIINTFDDHSVRENGNGYHEIADPVRLDEMEIPIQYITVGNTTIKDIPIFIQGGTVEARALEAQQGGVPQKFMSTSQDKWTSERCFLGDAYPNFSNWAEDKDNIFSTNPNSDHLYCASYPSHEQQILPFGVATGAESTVCNDIMFKKDDQEADESLVLREVTDGSSFDQLTTGDDAYVVYEGESNIPKYDGLSGASNELWAGTFALGNQVLSLTLPSGGAKSGQTLKFHVIHTHDQYNTGHFRAMSADGWSVTYMGYTPGITGDIITITLTDAMAAKLNSDKSVKVDGQGLTLTKITLE